MSSPDPRDQAMRTYYRERAAYYERVYAKPERQGELRQLEAWLPTLFAGRRVLEVACGTGWWTPHGASRAARWLATDVNPETMAFAQSKSLPPCVRFAEVDGYTLAELPAGDRFDAAFSGCWWSHVPLGRLPGWLATLHDRLEPGSVVVHLDNSFVQTQSTPIARRDADGNGYQLRTLDDGTTHEVLKNFPSADEAIAMLGPRAEDAVWHAHEHYWALEYRLR